MEGAVERGRKRLDIAIFTAWHTAMFALKGYSGKLAGKSLSDYLSDSPKPRDDQRMQDARAIHFFQSLKARGVPIEITRH
jgi:hypothetical protein